MNMNKDTAVFIFSNEVRAIKGAYDVGSTPELFKTFNKDIKVGDIVVVESSTRHGYTVVEVTEVDVEIDYSHSHPKWALDIVSVAEVESLREQESAMFKEVQDTERAKERDAIRQRYMESQPERFAKLGLVDMTEAKEESE